MTLSLFKKKEESRCNWYALFVETGKEDKVKERLEYRNPQMFTVFVPKRRIRERHQGTWTEKVHVLFPGYVLIKGFIDIEEMGIFRDVPGLYKLLKSDHKPLVIDESEVEVISKLICNNEVIGASDILIEDGNVKVISGPLIDLEGRITSIDKRKGRAKVVLDFLGEGRSIDLSVNVLKPV